MKKKLISGIAGVVAVGAAVLLATPYFFGQRAQSVLDEQHQILKSSSYLSIDSRQYERGWFSSTETTVLRFNPTLLGNIQAYLPDNIKTVLNQPITVVNHISHGPLVDFSLAAAHVESEFRYHPETEKVLKRFFGDQTPLQVSNTIAFDGSGEVDLQIPAFDYEELSGIKLNWQGLSGSTQYNRAWTQYEHDYRAPSLRAKLADKGDVAIDNISFKADSETGADGIALGSSSTQVGKFSVRWQEGIDYNFKLNELVQLITNLQIGAFINPTGTIAPSNIEVDDIKFDTQVKAVDQFINSEGRFQFAKLVYGKDTYGPLDIDVAAEHLDPKGLAALKAAMAKIAAEKMSEEQIQAALVQAAKGEAASLFTSNPQLKIRKFNFTTPQGKVAADGILAFNGLQNNDLNDVASLLKKTQADIKLSLPQALLESIAISQARSIFTVNPEDEAAGEANIDDINETLRLMVDSTVKSMQGEGYLQFDNGQISTQIQIKNGEVQLNGKVFKTEAEPEFNEADFANSASATSEVQASQP
ncbi:MAG: YdgA family protein [Neisseria sp.]|nr:YdgA family protein [Neisseria sp.]